MSVFTDLLHLNLTTFRATKMNQNFIPGNLEASKHKLPSVPLSFRAPQHLLSHGFIFPVHNFTVLVYTSFIALLAYSLLLSTTKIRRWWKLINGAKRRVNMTDINKVDSHKTSKMQLKSTNDVFTHCFCCLHVVKEIMQSI